VPGPGEPLWDADDRDKAKAYLLAQRELCPRCRTRQCDWLDAEGRFHDPPTLEPVVHSCPGCGETTRLKVAVEANARASAGSGPDASANVERALAGVTIAIEGFDPDRAADRDDDIDDEEGYP
jgi:hypothetical protein